jgi:hypothetical protein
MIYQNIQNIKNNLKLKKIKIFQMHSTAAIPNTPMCMADL